MPDLFICLSWIWDSNNWVRSLYLKIFLKSTAQIGGYGLFIFLEAEVRIIHSSCQNYLSLSLQSAAHSQFKINLKLNRFCQLDETHTQLFLVENPCNSKFNFCHQANWPEGGFSDAPFDIARKGQRILAIITLAIVNSLTYNLRSPFYARLFTFVNSHTSNMQFSILALCSDQPLCIRQNIWG